MFDYTSRDHLSLANTNLFIDVERDLTTGAKCENTNLYGA